MLGLLELTYASATGVNLKPELALGGLETGWLRDWAIGVEPKPRTRERAAATAKSAIETVRLGIGPPVAVDFSNGRHSEPHQRARPVLVLPPIIGTGSPCSIPLSC